LRGRITFITVAVATTSLAITAAQGIPSAPKNLRLVSGGNSNDPSIPTCVVAPATGKAAHAFYEALVRRPEHSCNWSLRDQAQLDSLTSDKVSTYFTYRPGADAYALAQDAAKFFVAPAAASGRTTPSLPTSQQLRMMLPRIESGSMLFSWDFFWGEEFRLNRGAINSYKSFKFQFAAMHGLWTMLTQMAWARDAAEVGRQTDSGFGGVDSGTLPVPMTKREPWQLTNTNIVQTNGSGSQFGVHHSKWTRYWVEIKLAQPPSAFTEWNARYGVTVQPNPIDPDGRWLMVSQWIADEHREPTRIMYRVPMSWGGDWPTPPRIARFDIEMNTSEADGFVGPWIGYARNVVLLHNYALPNVPENDRFIFQRPVR
jgi:hypothetical protein